MCMLRAYTAALQNELRISKESVMSSQQDVQPESPPPPVSIESEYAGWGLVVGHGV
jgi:hypothetical protein